MAGENVIPLYQELYNRGAVPDSHRPLVDELVRRGVIKGQGDTGGTPYTGKMGQVGQGEALGRSLFQGATLNWGDELYSMGKNLPTLFKDSDQYWHDAKADMAQFRARDKAAQEQYPKTFAGGQVAGALAPIAASYLAAAATGGAATPVATATTGRLASMVPAMAQAAKTGGLYGIVSGMGAAETPADATKQDIAEKTLEGGVSGGLLGAGVGAALPPVAAGAGAMVRGLITRPMQAFTMPDRFAASKVAEALGRGNAGKTADEIAQVAGQQADLAPGTILADVGGKPVRNLMRAAIDQPNAGSTGFLKYIEDRQKQLPQAIQDKMITPAFGQPGNYEAALQKLLKDRDAAAGPAFKEAYGAASAPSEDLLHLIETRPDFFGPKSRFWNNVQRDIEAERGLVNYHETPDISWLEVAHRMKQQLQNAIDWSGNPMSRLDNTGAANTSQASLKALHAQYMDALRKSQGPGVEKYFSALEKYGDDSNVARAMKRGFEDSRSESPTAMQEFFSSASQPEKDAYRLGMGRALADRNMDSRRYGTDRIRADWDNPMRDQQLQAALPPPPPPRADGTQMPGQLDRLNAVKDALREQIDTRAAASGNSQTNAFLHASQDATKEAEQVTQGLRLAGSAMKGDISPFWKLAESNLQRLSGMTPRVSAEVLRLLRQPAASMEGMQAWQLDPAIRAIINSNAAWDAQKPALMSAATRGLLGPAVPGNRSGD